MLGKKDGAGFGNMARSAWSIQSKYGHTVFTLHDFPDLDQRPDPASGTGGARRNVPQIVQDPVDQLTIAALANAGDQIPGFCIAIAGDGKYILMPKAEYVGNSGFMQTEKLFPTALIIQEQRADP